ncbi:hypothetical protein CI105_02305 [Candidatus Izimaplasma bacterium ZiA1]|uniref:helix-turn-helix domain-containing protein n=1 Tax=Candidatus Izimoplasma sp. ZiA1 TaxID=2024899 RepID=UPI000BAA6A57|nr:hypothetical protein CI105_02305 [Candidatus Izimaplasma bacterium ZiA1]
MNSQNIGNFLLELRKKNNLTQKDISKICNVSTQAVSKWERGDSVPDIELLERLSILYKISINEIINGEKQEVYLDIEKRKNILTLTFSVLIFIVYFFPWYHSSFQMLDVVIKGYTLVFDGTGGAPVVIALIGFFILVANLIIYLFLLTKVINKKESINNYLLVSSFIIGIISFIAIATGDFYFIPQLLMITYAITTYILNSNNESSNISALSEYNSFRKLSVNDKKLKYSLPKDLENSKLVVSANRLNILSIIIYSLILIILSFVLVISLINKDGIIEENNFILAFISSLLVLSSHIYIHQGFKYTFIKETSLIAFFTSLVFPAYLALGYLIMGVDDGIFYFLLVLIAFSFFPILFYRIHSKTKLIDLNKSL